MSVLDAVLGLIVRRHPEAAKVIDAARILIPLADRAAPVVIAAAKEGPGALEAARRAAPELDKAIRDFAGAASPAGVSSPSVTHAVAKAVLAPEAMSDDEQRMLDRLAPTG